MTRFAIEPRFLHGLLAAVALALAVTGCSDGSASSGSGTTSSTGQGTLAVEMTDAPTEGVTAVNVHVVGLKVKPASGPVHDMAFAGTTINLLALQNDSQTLTVEQVPADNYQFIQVELDQAQSNVVVNGNVLPLQIPSQEIKVLGGFEVFENGETTVLLDFDAERSLVQQGNGQWLLKPVILMADVAAS